MDHKPKLGILLIVVGVIAILISGGYFLVQNFEQEKKKEENLLPSEEHENIEENLLPSEEHENIEENLLPSEENKNKEETLQENKEDEVYSSPYIDYFEENSDMVAWLKIEDTIIDYPVMQTMEDENYYLYRGFDKKDNKDGALILDTDSLLSSTVSNNLIIHGHNMKSGNMFGTLTNYTEEEYYKEHSRIELYTKEGVRTYEIISVFHSQVFKKSQDVFKYYKFFEATKEEEFLDFYKNIKDMSFYDTGVTASFGDNFITLSTCVYHVENGRLVVVGKEIERTDNSKND